MIVLIDFENTHVSGLDGYEYLNAEDTAVLYYSDENSAVTKGCVDDLKAHNVNVRLVKLLKQHSNALDMYIASTTGMYADKGETIAIVSKDKGYGAVKDFWHSLIGTEILLGETIRECFLHSLSTDNERINKIRDRNLKVTLVDAFSTINTIPNDPRKSRTPFSKNISSVKPRPVAAVLPVSDTPVVADPIAALAARTLNNVQAAAPAPFVQEAPAKTEGSTASGEHGNSRSGRGRNDRYRRNGNNYVRDSQSHGEYVNPYAEPAVLSPVPQDEAPVIIHPDQVPEQHLNLAPIEVINPVPVNDTAKQQENSGNAESRSTSGKEESKPVQVSSSVPVKTPQKAKADPNRVQYVYDPAAGKMICITGQEMAEEASAGEKAENPGAAEKAEPAAAEKVEENVQTVLQESVKEEIPETAAVPETAAEQEKTDAPDKKAETPAKKPGAKRNYRRKNDVKKENVKADAEKTDSLKEEPHKEQSAEDKNQKAEAKAVEKPARRRRKPAAKKTEEKAEVKEEQEQHKEVPEHKEIPAREVHYDAAEVLAKFGENAEGLQQYYINLTKTYGREDGRQIYNETKKAFTQALKKRTAAQ